MKNKSKNKSWGGRFAKSQSSLFLEYSASIHFDSRLAGVDIFQNKVYAKALHKAKIINKSELAKLTSALNAIDKEIENGKFKFKAEDEDIHMNIERRLKEKVSSLSGKLHTGRSRNDQVATDTRLYLLLSSYQILGQLKKLQKAFLKQAEKNIDCFMPGYTHLQMAQPIRTAHWFLAYLEMFKRDSDRFISAFVSADVMPLGSGALAGNNFNINRDYLAKELGFSRISRNSLDGVSDRDFGLDFCYAGSVFFTHLSRLSEELIIYSSREFSAVTLPDELCTGSSIMPQKKNPDLPELLRGKTGRLNGNLLNLLTMLKGLPLAYNKDMQEDKPPIFDTVDEVTTALPMVTQLVSKMKFNKKLLKERIKDGFITAVDLADYLAIKGLPFREAHHVVGLIVKECEEAGKKFTDLSVKDFKKYSPLFKKDVFLFIDPERSPDRKKGKGMTSLKSITNEIELLKEELNA